MNFTVTAENRNNGVVVARVAGRLDAATAPGMENALVPLARDPATTRFVLDGAGLGYVSSAGLRVVLVLVKSLAPRKAKLYVASLPDAIVDLLKMTGFLSLMELRSTVDECLD